MPWMGGLLKYDGNSKMKVKAPEDLESERKISSEELQEVMEVCQNCGGNRCPDPYLKDVKQGITTRDVGNRG